MNYIQPTKLDIPAVGCLFEARKQKKQMWDEMKRLRQRIKDEPLGGNRRGLRIALLRVQELHNFAMTAEREALEVLERRANELDLTTIRQNATT